MKIVHIVIVGPYTEGMTYQENILPDCQARQGHDVTVIANCTCWNRSEMGRTDAIVKRMESGVKLIRLPFIHVINAYITEKLRWVKGLYDVLKAENPEFIFLHDFMTLSVRQIVNYLKKFPKTVLVMDSHTSFNNSAKNWISRHFLHGIIYRYCGKQIYPYARSIYFIGAEPKRFLMEVYKFPADKLEYLPLGGIILSDEKYRFLREKVRRTYAISEGTTVFLHSGKLDAGKKTIELIEAFEQRKKKDGVMQVIIGDINHPERRRIIEALAMKDNAIRLLGWRSGDELFEFLCAADVYLQPGTPSATLQLAMCNRCGVVIRNYESYRFLFGNTGIMISSDNELLTVIDDLCDSKVKVEQLREDIFQIARKLLDYNRQSEMILAGRYAS